MSDQTGDILTNEDVASYLMAGMSIYYLVADGKLPAFKLGGAWRSRFGDLNQWIASRIGEAGE